VRLEKQDCGERERGVESNKEAGLGHRMGSGVGKGRMDKGTVGCGLPLINK
jgi:hypothetical protein